MTPRFLGNFIEPSEHQTEYLHIGFSPSSIPLKQRWRNNGLSADFLADYLSAFYPGENTQQHEELRDSVSHIANELLENAMKYNDESAVCPIHIRLHLNPEHLRIYVTNSLTFEHQTHLQKFIEKLLHSDPQSLYLQLIETSSLDTSLETSGLGLLGLLEDYQAQLGWKFSQTESEGVSILLVTTMALLPIENHEHSG